MKTLLDLLASFPGRGEATALIHRTGIRRFTYTYKELYDLSLRMNRLLEVHGVGKGDRVLLWAPNGPWWTVAFWGCVARGTVVVPVDFQSGSERASAIAELAQVRLVVGSRFKPERLAGFPSILAEDLEFLLRGIESLHDTAHPSPDDMAELVYTSGTTGNPKGVILTHGNLMANLLQVNGHLSIVTSEYVFLSLLPLSHLFEQMGGFLTPLYRGAAIVHLRTLKPSAILDALRGEDIRAVISVPRLLHLLRGSIEREVEAKHLGELFRLLLRHADRMPLRLRKLLFLPIRRRFGRHFVLFVSGGAALAPELFRFWSAMDIAVVEGYGLTECSPVLAANTLERKVAGSVGKALPGVEIRIENDEILARGMNVFPGYYGNERATLGAFTRDGWFRTGDLGRIDEHGDLRVLGRRKELIVTGAGVNVYPDELENILNSLSGVREACVIGLDRGSGEEVHAVLLPDGSGRRPDEILLEANSRLDPLHRITGFSLWPEPEFPKTTTLKIRKFLVKERLAEGGEGRGAASTDPLVNLIARITECPVRDIREESCLVTDLGLTSIGGLELVTCIEQEYRLDLEDSVIGPGTTVADLRMLVARRERQEEARRLRFWTQCLFFRGMRRLLDTFLHGPLFRMFVTLRVTGRENLAGLEFPVLFISNHLSYLDQPAILFSLPSRVRYTTATAAWEEFFFQNYRTWLGKVWKRFTYEYGTMFLNLFPLSQTGGFRRSLAFMGRLADQGLNILLFPEGARSEDGRLLPFRPGIGVMVRELSVPVVPVRILGMEIVMPRGAGRPRGGIVEVRFGKPIVFGMETPEEIVERARRAVEELGC
jgi:long-chain acyl-CoA synthetase